MEEKKEEPKPKKDLFWSMEQKLKKDTEKLLKIIEKRKNTKDP